MLNVKIGISKSISFSGFFFLLFFGFLCVLHLFFVSLFRFSNNRVFTYFSFFFFHLARILVLLHFQRYFAIKSEYLLQYELHWLLFGFGYNTKVDALHIRSIQYFTCTMCSKTLNAFNFVFWLHEHYLNFILKSVHFRTLICSSVFFFFFFVHYFTGNILYQIQNTYRCREIRQTFYGHHLIVVYNLEFFFPLLLFKTRARV